MRKPLPRWAAFAAIVLAAPLLVWLEYGTFPVEDAVLAPIMRMSLSRLLAAAVFFVLLLTQGYHVLRPWRRPLGKALMLSLPAFAVVINNLPILSMLWGDAYIIHGTTAHWVWFSLQCLAIGLFEEIAFRGVIFLRLAESRRRSRPGLLISILLTSAIFGGMHVVNLLTGADPLWTILQIGYSFLIGAMCSVVLLKTANLWLCVALHAIYDFCGMLMPTLGGGSWWDTPTIVFTALLAVATTVYMIVLFARMEPQETDRIYCKMTSENE